MSSVARRNLLQQANFVQILRRNGERDGIADGLMKAVIGAVLEQKRLVLVGALVKIVAEFVMHGDEIHVAHLDAHLDPQIVLVVDVPGAGVADHIAIRGLVNNDRSQKVCGNGAKPSEVKKPSPYFTMPLASRFFALSSSVTS